MSLERATAARSSADMAHPILKEFQSPKQDNLNWGQDAVVASTVVDDSTVNEEGARLR